MPAKKTIAQCKKAVIKRFMAQYRGRPCEVCGTTYATVAHHLIPKGRCMHHVVSDENIIVLCQGHHTFGGDISAHSTSALVMDRFIDWVKANKPEQWAWAEKHERDNADKCGKIPWRDLYEEGAFK